MMKTFLLLSVSSVATAGALPSLPAKIILSAFVLIAALAQAARARDQPAGRPRTPLNNSHALGLCFAGIVFDHLG